MRKYEPIVRAVSAEQKNGFKLREITLTSTNLGTLSAQQVRAFNKAVKETLKRLMKKVKGWGAIWSDEVGRDNTNLHAHILFWGPYIPQPLLAEVWKKVSGHQVVWIKEASGKGSGALLYLLKYVSKPPTNNPHALGLLEVAFHKTRRIHTTGVFSKHSITGLPAETNPGDPGIAPDPNYPGRNGNGNTTMRVTATRRTTSPPPAAAQL
jgi:hypothetical protein